MYIEPIDKSLMTQGVYVFEYDPAPDAIRLDHPFRSEYFTFILIEAGSISMTINFREYTFTASDIVFIAPAVVSELGSISPDCKFVGMAFTGEFLMDSGLPINSSDTLDVLLGNELSPSLRLNDDEYDIIDSLLHFFRRKLSYPDSGNRKQILINAFLTLMLELTAIHNMVVNRMKPPLSTSENITLRFLNLLGAHYKAQRSVQFYADAIHLSTRHLSQVIKKVTGKTAGELIDGAVMMEARVLLSNPAYNVTQIADMLHFSNVSVFGKFFRKNAGKSPTQFREIDPKSYFSTNKSHLQTL